LKISTASIWHNCILYSVAPSCTLSTHLHSHLPHTVTQRNLTTTSPKAKSPSLALTPTITYSSMIPTIRYVEELIRADDTRDGSFFRGKFWKELLDPPADADVARWVVDRGHRPWWVQQPPLLAYTAQNAGHHDTRLHIHTGVSKYT
jgi:hypothetical protein